MRDDGALSAGEVGEAQLLLQQQKAAMAAVETQLAAARREQHRYTADPEVQSAHATTKRQLTTNAWRCTSVMAASFEYVGATRGGGEVATASCTAGEALETSVQASAHPRKRSGATWAGARATAGWRQAVRGRIRCHIGH